MANRLTIKEVKDELDAFKFEIAEKMHQLIGERTATQMNYGDEILKLKDDLTNLENKISEKMDIIIENRLASIASTPSVTVSNTTDVQKLQEQINELMDIVRSHIEIYNNHIVKQHGK